MGALFPGVFLFLLAQPRYSNTSLFELLRPHFLISPHFALSKSIDMLYTASIMSVTCQEQCDLMPECSMDLMCSKNSYCCGMVPTRAFCPYCLFNLSPSYSIVDELRVPWLVLQRPLKYFAGAGIAYFVLLLIIDFRILDYIIYCVVCCLCNCFKSTPPDSDDIDEDVKNEKYIVNAMSFDEIKSTNLVMNQLSKFYWKFLAVNQLSVRVHQ